MKRLFIIYVALVLLFSPRSGQAQTAHLPITAKNLTRIEQVARLGNGVVRQMVFSPDEARFAVATTLAVWVFDLNDATKGLLLEGQNGAASVAFSPHGTRTAGGGDDGSMMVWDAATGETVARLENHLYPISAVAWGTDGRLVASGDWSGVVRVWDAETWGEYRVFPTDERIERLVFEDADSLIAYSSDASTAWQMSSGDVVSQSEAIGGLAGTAGMYGERVADWAADSGEIVIWERGERLAALDGFYGELGGVFFTDDGRVGSRSLAAAHLWSLENGESDNAPPPVTSPDGSQMARFGNDGVIRLMDAATGEQLAALYGHIRKVNAAAYSSDGTLLVSASDDGTIQVWDATVNEDSGSLLTLEGHTSGVTSVAFNRDGTLIASTGYDGTVRLWGVLD